MKDRDSLVDVDLYNLHKEWMAQPKLRREYGDKVADAKLAFAEAKANLELVVAKLDQAIRANPKKYGLERATDKAVENAIKLRPRYQEALTLMNRAKHRVDKAQVIVDALEHRKPCLQDLVVLFLQDYWADPRLPGSRVAKAKVRELVTEERKHRNGRYGD